MKVVYILSTTHLETSTLFTFKRAIMPFDCPDKSGLTQDIEFAKGKFNGDDRDRTCNLRLAKPALSQLSYVPEPN